MAVFLNILLAGVAILVLLVVKRRQARRIPVLFQEKCGQIATIWGRDIFLHSDVTKGTYFDFDSIVRRHEQKGATYLIDSLLGSTIIQTIAPENMQAVYSRGNEFGVQPYRLAPMEYFVGQGFLTTDGQIWNQSRRMLKPTFGKTNISDLGFIERETANVISKIKDGKTFDLEPLLMIAFLNTSIHFLLGVDTTAYSSDAPYTAEQFVDAFQSAVFWSGMRHILGPLKFLAKFNAARRCTHEYIDFYIKQALQKGSASSLQTDESGGQSRQSLVQSLASQTDDIAYVRGQILQAMLASQETTAVLISNTIFSLARHPQYWDKLRKMVLERGEDLFTFDNLSKFEFLQDILKESLRLYPVFPIMARSALRDTTLPVGGGPQQDQPIFIAKDTLVETSFYTLHRSQEVFGLDRAGAGVEDFYPERWNAIQPKQWEYITFGGGQRACLGKEKVLAEAAFVVCRLAQVFERLESCDGRPWKGQQTLTGKNVNGCKVALHRSS